MTIGCLANPSGLRCMSSNWACSLALRSKLCLVCSILIPPETLCTFTLTCSDFGSKPSWCQSCWCYTIFLNLYSSGFCTAQGLLGRNGLRSDYSRGRLSAQNYSSKAVPSAMLCAAIYRNVVKSAQQQKSRQLQTGKCTVQPSLLQESKTFETKTRTWRTG